MLASTSKARLSLPPCTCGAASTSRPRSLSKSSRGQKSDAGSSYTTAQSFGFDPSFAALRPARPPPAASTPRSPRPTDKLKPLREHQRPYKPSISPDVRPPRPSPLSAAPRPITFGRRPSPTPLSQSTPSFAATKSAETIRSPPSPPSATSLNARHNVWKPLPDSNLRPFAPPPPPPPLTTPGRIQISRYGQSFQKAPIQRTGYRPSSPLKTVTAYELEQRYGGRLKFEAAIRQKEETAAKRAAAEAEWAAKGQSEGEVETAQQGERLERDVKSGYGRTVERKGGMKEVKARVIDVAKQAVIPSACEVEFLAEALASTEAEVKAVMRRIDIIAPLNERRALTPDEASLVAMEMGFTPVIDKNAIEIVPDPPHPQPTLQPVRPPIVCVMGHVDHGKTTLLDTLRSASVAEGEAGGITQHIGAFEVPLSKLYAGAGRKVDTSTVKSTITFLDTPGHAAFKAMRARGAGVTDVAVLVVAADDGVKPQTLEVIELLKGTEVALVVAITKCDKPGADTNRVEGELAGTGVTVERLGGETPCVHVSAFSKIGLDDLVETITTIAEVRDLRAEREGVRAEARIIESHVDAGQGNVATIVVTRGALKPGQVVIAGEAFCKIRRLVAPGGTTLREAFPGQPVEISGWRSLPNAGDRTLQAKDETEAQRAVETRRARTERVKQLAEVAAMNAKATQWAEQLNKTRSAAAVAAVGAVARDATQYAQWLARVKTNEETRAAEHEVDPHEVRIIVKADFDGTLEAVTDALVALKDQRAGTKIIGTGVGDVTNADVQSAHASQAMIVAFNVKVSRPAQQLKEVYGDVDILSSKVIYTLVADVTERVEAAMPKLYDLRQRGQAVVAQRFSIPVPKGKLGNARSQGIAGCRITTGLAERQADVRVLREGKEVWRGKLEALKQQKEDKDVVPRGQECGLAFEGWDDFQVEDVVEFSQQVEITQSLGV